jgi:hypothetical protein
MMVKMQNKISNQLLGLKGYVALLWCRRIQFNNPIVNYLYIVRVALGLIREIEQTEGRQLFLLCTCTVHV